MGGTAGGGPAAKAGLRRGDVITAVAGAKVRSSTDLISAVDGHAPGSQVTVRVARGGHFRTFTVTLGTRPNQAPSS